MSKFGTLGRKCTYLVEDILSELGIIHQKEDDVCIVGNIALKINDLSEVHCRENNRVTYEYYLEQGISLFALTSNLTVESITRFIKAKLGLLPVIYARKCSMSDTDLLDQSAHIQGYTRSTICRSLHYNGEIVGYMGAVIVNGTILINRVVFDKYRVVGGASRMLKSIQKEYPDQLIVSFSNNGYSDGSLYAALGFRMTNESKIDMWYSKDGELLNRRGFQKKRLPAILDEFDESLTEIQNMINNGYSVYYGAGTKRWELGENKNAPVKMSVIKVKKPRAGVIKSEHSKELLRIDVANKMKEGAHNSQVKHACPHCGKEGNGAIMKRWHFDNCKKKV